MQFGWWRRSIILSAQALGFDDYQKRALGWRIPELRWMACELNTKQNFRGCKWNRLWSDTAGFGAYLHVESAILMKHTQRRSHVACPHTQPINSWGSGWFKVKWKHAATHKLWAAVGLVARLSSKSIFRACSLRSPAVRTPVWAWRAFIYTSLLRQRVSKPVISVCMTYVYVSTLLAGVFGVGKLTSAKIMSIHDSGHC